MAKPSANHPPKIPPWTERNEVNLLNAVLEISNEPVEDYNPRINLFDRINNSMEKSLTDREILDKINELRNRFEKKCWKIKFGKHEVKKTRAFAVSEKIWGKGVEMKMKKKEERVAKSSKVTPQETSRPNWKRERELAKKQNDIEPACKKQKVKKKFCFFCSKFGHIARDCFKKITKQPTKQQKTKDISKGSVVVQFETENKCEELSGGLVFASLKVNPQEASRPSHKQEHKPTKKIKDAKSNDKCQSTGQKLKVKERSCFNCGKDGHLARDCLEKIAKQPTKQQEMKDISKGSVVFQFETDNKCEKPSHGSVSASWQPGSLASEHSQPGAHPLASKKNVEDSNSSQSFAHHQPSTEQRMEVFNSLQPGVNQCTSQQRTEDIGRFNSGGYTHTLQQNIPFNRFQPSSHQHTSNQWNREPFTPPISPQPPKWGPRPPNPIAMPHSFSPRPPSYQYPPPPTFTIFPPPYSMNYTYPNHPN